MTYSRTTGNTVGHLETGDLWLNLSIFILPENTYHQVKKKIVLQKRFLKMQMVVLEENMTFKKRIIKRH